MSHARTMPSRPPEKSMSSVSENASVLTPERCRSKTFASLMMYERQIRFRRPAMATLLLLLLQPLLFDASGVVRGWRWCFFSRRGSTLTSTCTLSRSQACRLPRNRALLTFTAAAAAALHALDGKVAEGDPVAAAAAEADFAVAALRVEAGAVDEGVLRVAEEGVADEVLVFVDGDALALAEDAEEVEAVRVLVAAQKVDELHDLLDLHLGDDLEVVANQLNVHLLDGQEAANLRLEEANVAADVELVLAAVAVQVGLEDRVDGDGNLLGVLVARVAQALEVDGRGAGVVRAEGHLEHGYKRLDDAHVAQNLLAHLVRVAVDDHPVGKLAQRLDELHGLQVGQLALGAVADIHLQDRDDAADKDDVADVDARHVGDDVGVVKHALGRARQLEERRAVPLDGGHAVGQARGNKVAELGRLRVGVALDHLVDLGMEPAAVEVVLDAGVGALLDVGLLADDGVHEEDAGRVADVVAEVGDKLAAVDLAHAEVLLRRHVAEAHLRLPRDDAAFGGLAFELDLEERDGARRREEAVRALWVWVALADVDVEAGLWLGEDALGGDVAALLLVEELDDVAALEQLGVVGHGLAERADGEGGRRDRQVDLVLAFVGAVAAERQLRRVQKLAGRLGALEHDLVGHANKVALCADFVAGHDAEPGVFEEVCAHLDLHVAGLALGGDVAADADVLLCVEVEELDELAVDDLVAEAALLLQQVVGALGVAQHLEVEELVVGVDGIGLGDVGVFLAKVAEGLVILSMGLVFVVRLHLEDARHKVADARVALVAASLDAERRVLRPD
eukprot:m.168472 g.168472  ORF g.168472 m.168472 type:complete len:793 (-) comp17217_c0_seq2:366-2744(-)